MKSLHYTFKVFKKHTTVKPKLHLTPNLIEQIFLRTSPPTSSDLVHTFVSKINTRDKVSSTKNNSSTLRNSSKKTTSFSKK